MSKKSRPKPKIPALVVLPRSSGLEVRWVLLYGGCRQPNEDASVKDCYPGAIASKGREAYKRT